MGDFVIRPESLECDRIVRLGYDVALIDAAPLRVGALVSRHALMVVAVSTGRLVAELRSTKEGEYVGSAWVEEVRAGVPVGRKQYRAFLDVLAALEAHPAAKARAA